MAPSLLAMFRVLSSFSPARQSLADAPWQAYVNWAIANGLGGMAAYNLEYRLAGGDAPDWVRDRLLAVYQGTANDNVMKLVNFRRILSKLEGRRVVVLGAASFAESLYPHIAFRPVIDISLLLPPADVAGFAGFLAQAHFKSAPERQLRGATRSLSDGRTSIHLLSGVLGPRFEVEESAMLDRAVPLAAYGRSALRLAPEDALLVLCLEHASLGYAVPYVSFVDLRELLLGSPALGGSYCKPLETELVRSRAHTLDLDLALYASCEIARALYPETGAVAAALRPLLSRPMEQLLIDRLLVQPIAKLGRMREFRGAARLRRMLTRLHKSERS